MKLDITGQKSAVAEMEKYIEKCADTGSFSVPILGEGPAAIGKSKIFGAFTDALANETGANVYSFDSAGEFSRSDSSAILALVESLKKSRDGMKSIYLVDEFHTLPFNPMTKNPSPVNRLFSSLLYGSGQGWNRTGSLEFLGENVSYDAGNIQIIGMTNHPKSVGGTKNSEAVLRRFYRIALTRYTDAEMKRLIPVFFHEKGREVSPDAATFLSKVHRGTFEAVAELLKILPWKGAITKEMILEAMPGCNFQARGFRRDEMQALLHLYTTQELTKPGNLSLHFPGLDIGEFYRHAKRQMAKVKGETVNVPFIYVNARGEYRLTEAGEAFTKAQSAAIRAL